MAYWADDRALYLDQRQRDAAQARARRVLQQKTGQGVPMPKTIELPAYEVAATSGSRITITWRSPGLRRHIILSPRTDYSHPEASGARSRPTIFSRAEGPAATTKYLDATAAEHKPLVDALIADVKAKGLIPAVLEASRQRQEAAAAARLAEKAGQVRGAFAQLVAEMRQEPKFADRADPLAAAVADCSDESLVRFADIIASTV